MQTPEQAIYVLSLYFANLLWNLGICFQFLDEKLRVHQKFIFQVLMFVGQWIQHISLKKRSEEAEELNF